MRRSRTPRAPGVARLGGSESVAPRKRSVAFHRRLRWRWPDGRSRPASRGRPDPASAIPVRGEDSQSGSTPGERAALLRPDLQHGRPGTPLSVPRHELQLILQSAQFALDPPVLGRAPVPRILPPVPEPPAEKDGCKLQRLVGGSAVAGVPRPQKPTQITVAVMPSTTAAPTQMPTINNTADTAWSGPHHEGYRLA
jgi:hypothetical protein